MKLSNLMESEFPAGSAGEMQYIKAYKIKLAASDGSRREPCIIKHSNLTSLLGCPDETPGGFNCSGNELKSLEGCPKKCGGDFLCVDNELTSLVGMPAVIDRGNFYCQHNKLTSLEGCSTIVSKDFICGDNDLTSLEHCPNEVGAMFHCANNDITALENFHTSVANDFICTGNHLTSLRDVHKLFGYVNGVFDASDNPITSHVLGLLLIPGIVHIILDDEQATEILNKHLGRGRVGLLAAQRELNDAGLSDFAQL